MLFGALCVAVLLIGNAVEARTVSEAKAQVKMEYQAGSMDEETYNDLMAILNSATDAESMAVAQEAFNIMVSVHAGGSIDGDAAARMMGPLDGL